MKSETYEPQNGFAKGKQNLEAFGMQQNTFNSEMLHQIADVQAQMTAIQAAVTAIQEALSQTEARILSLEQSQERNMKLFGQCAAEMGEMQQAINNLRLSTKLNSNSIDRLIKRGEDGGTQ